MIDHSVSPTAQADWLPISTAPLDGTPVRLKCEPHPEFGLHAMYWDVKRGRARREKADLSLRDMGSRLGFSAVYLSDVERNRRNCTPKIREAYEALS